MISRVEMQLLGLQCKLTLTWQCFSLKGNKSINHLIMLFLRKSCLKYNLQGECSLLTLMSVAKQEFRLYLNGECNIENTTICRTD